VALNENDFSPIFAKQMEARMRTSLHKYGRVKDSRATVDFIKSLEERLEMYKQTHNTENLIDVANFAMMEYEIPAFSDAYFRAQSSQESPGRIEL
jgi:hypothetical protein